MSTETVVLIAVGVTLVAGVLGFLLAKVLGGRGDRGTTAEHILAEARLEAKATLARAEEEARAIANTYKEREDATLELRRVEARSSENRLVQREQTLEQRAANLAQREQLLIQREDAVSAAQAEIGRLHEDARANLERISGVDSKAAKEELLAGVEDEARRDAMRLVRDLEVRAREEADKRSKRILATAIQRNAAQVVSEITASVVDLPSDDLKGRIIGREGRNIRSFEATTGTNLIVDDSADTVSVSTFDPIRREIARLTLVALIEDGRIHPASIEQFHEKAKVEIERTVRDAGEWAMVEVGVGRMHPELVNLLGRLKYRTSYGQNVLDHSLEAAHIAGSLASELGIDPGSAKRAALLHDIGKAVTHEVEGSHALIGAEIARRFEEDAKIVHAIEAHHNEVEPRTVLAVITQAADAVSAARPGARREQLEGYVRRLERLEELALAFDGVDRVFAMQAGREIRVVVDPGSIDDLGAAALAQQISRSLEESLHYPGQIQVTVIREFRATDYAR